MRPRVPRLLIDSHDDEFRPAPELNRFVWETFFDEDSAGYNEHHRHLRTASIGYLWTNVTNIRQMKEAVATAEIPKPPTQSSVWAKARYRYQIREWFGTDNLDFLITVNARYVKTAPHRNFLAVLDHELYHCAQKKDEFGSPKFNEQTGLPLYGILGHDVEEFVGIIERYGPKAGAGKTIEFIAAAKKKPLIGPADIKELCGTCRK